MPASAVTGAHLSAPYGLFLRILLFIGIFTMEIMASATSSQALARSSRSSTICRHCAATNGHGDRHDEGEPRYGDPALSVLQIADSVNLAARLNTNYITVDTNWEYPSYMQLWASAIRAAGRHVWFRIHPNQWGDNNGTTGIMMPAAYLASEQAFIAAHPTLFQPGDILDPCPEPENGLYWIATYGHGWTANSPNVATEAYNAFIRDTTTVADQTLNAAGISGVITTVRSTNSFFATHPGDLEPATVALLGHVTFDSYPEGTTTDPATATAARVNEIKAVAQAWPGVPIILGEMGYSNKVAVDDTTQEAVLNAEFAAIAPLPYIAGINYWVGAGTNNSGGYTHIFSGSTGAWTLRPAALDLAAFFAQEQQAHAG